MVRVYIGVGSNIEPLIHVPAALDALLARGIEVDASSRFYRTEPIGRPGQPAYANGVWRASVDLGPRALRSLLRGVEDEIGRVRSADKFAARSIDLDIVLYGELEVSDGELTIPDPHILERPFLARCLAEIDPHLHLPGASSSLAEADVLNRVSLEEYREITLHVNERLENNR